MPLGPAEQSFGLRGSNADVELPRALYGGESASLFFFAIILSNIDSGWAMHSHAEY